MLVRVLLFGVLKEIAGTAEEAIEVPWDATLGGVFERYAGRFETLRDKRSSILFAKNGEFATPDTKVSEGDEIAFLPPVSGGSMPVIRDEEGHVFALTRERLDGGAFARELQRPEDGAVVQFDGIVRNNTKGQKTLYLDYECYEPLAIAQMSRVGREIAAQFSIGRIGLMHRLGRLEIGESSVVVVATAPHRKAAFEAALEAINRLKREVPIWKKEYFVSGAVWVDGEWDEKLLARKNDSL